jgi:hypothetical protein
MKPPIFVIFASNGDLLGFDSAAGVEHYVESIDIENGEYQHVFDSEGRLLALEVERPTKRHKFLGLESVELTPVHLVERESQPTHSRDLMTALLGALARVGQPGERANATMGELVEEAFRKFRVR